ncbi:MAG: PKD domain-containing protein [Methanomicrobiales archaeon]|nr:PKD domain-containing protein [Methanomicrobiales archaeon]
MDRNVIRAVLLVAFLAACLITPVLAGTTESIISVGTPDSDQLVPVISGDRLAWVDYRGGTGEIYLYHILTGEEQQVSPEGDMCDSPDISGDWMVWRVYNESSGGYDLDIHDLATGEDIRISSGGADHSNPDVDGIHVVWDDNRAGNTDIYVYDLSTGEETQITTDPGNENNPAISGTRIVWQVCGGDDCDLSLHDIASNVTESIGSPPEYQSSPAISGPVVSWLNGPYGSSDISYLDLETDETGSITSRGSALNPPVISEGRIVWEDNRNGNTDLYVYDLTSREEMRLVDDPNEQMFPSIDGDRIAWTDYRNGMADVYLGTLDTSLAVPVAAFSADPTLGGSPLTVLFTDESTGDPATWRWDFGDGESSDQPSPSHTYGSAGTFSVILTISNAVGRSLASQPDSIHSGSGPTASFTVTPRAGIPPLAVQFTDTSTGNPENWTWEFGDGETSDQPSPSHTYTTWGMYYPRLTARNMFGETSTSTGPIEVLNGTRTLASTDIGGLTVEECGSIQCAYLDPSAFSSLDFDPSGDPAVVSVVPDPSSGWGRITLQARETGFSDMGNGTLTGTVTDVMLESLPLRPLTFSEATGGNLEITYALNLSRYPVPATVDATVWENVTATDYPRFLQAAYDANYASISAVAYTVHFSTAGLSGVRSATLNLSAMSSWVDQYGIDGNMTLLRLGDDGTTQGIKYRDLVADPSTGISHFLYVSPKGLSRFALASTSGSGNPFQLLVLSASAHSPGGQTGTSSNDYPQGFPTSAPQPAATAGLATFRETGRPEMSDGGITTDSFHLVSSDELASLTIAPATRLTSEQGLPVQEISVRPAGAVPISPPEGSYYTYTGIAYDLQPEGVIFNPPAEVQFRVDPSRWQEATQYQVLARGGEGEPWEVLPTRQDDATHTVTATVSHFSLHALFSWPMPVTTPPQAVPTLQAAPKQVPRTPLTTISGVVIWAASTAQAHVLEFVVAILLVGGVGITLRRGVPVKAFRPWVFLYLISLAAYLWATFQALIGGPLWISAWIFIATAGINLIVHLFRFDRITIFPDRAPRWTGSRLY